MLHLLPLIAVALLLAQGEPATRPASAPAPARPRLAKRLDAAPDFRVADHTGKERTLAEFRGRRALLWFFPKADTPG